MTVENLHDAIGQLPSDLVTAVDKKRSRKRSVIPFQRYAAMAACIALMLCGTWVFAMTMTSRSSTEKAAAPEMMQAADSVTNAPAARAPEAEVAPEAPAAFAGEYGAGTTEETFRADEIPPEGMEEEAHAPIILSLTDIQYAPTQNIGTAVTTSEPVIRVIRSVAELEALRQKLGYYTMEYFDTCAARYDDAWFEKQDLLLVVVKGLYADGSFTLDSVFDSDGNWCIKFYSGGPYTGDREDRFVFAGLEKDAIPEGSHLFAMFEVP